MSDEKSSAAKLQALTVRALADRELRAREAHEKVVAHLREEALSSFRNCAVDAANAGEFRVEVLTLGAQESRLSPAGAQAVREVKAHFERLGLAVVVEGGEDRTRVFVSWSPEDLDWLRKKSERPLD